MNTEAIEKRKLDIYNERLTGLTYKAIAKDYNISAARVGQIFRRVELSIKKAARSNTNHN